MTWCLFFNPSGKRICRVRRIFTPMSLPTALTRMFLLFSMVAGVLSCRSVREVTALQTDTIVVHRLSPQLYRHVSQLFIPNFGNFPCNGMVFINNGEAMVFDTPVGEEASRQLIEWLQEERKVAIKGIVVNHFHDDCIDGLAVFHEKGIPSYANRATIGLIDTSEFVPPQNGFDKQLTIEIGGSQVHNRYFGPAHSVDNIVSWIPDEKAIFGGCMVKALEARKGNLNDADVNEWSQTINKIKAAYPGLKIVVPGHGAPGGVELLDYTSQLFSNEAPSNQ